MSDDTGNLITATGLTRHFALPRRHLFAPKPHRTAVSDVSVDVHEGEFLAIVGESGAGKSTLGRLLVGLDQPDSGEVEFRGETHRNVGMVFQDPFASLDPRKTVGWIIGEPLRALGWTGDREEAVNEILSRVHLGAWRAAQYPHELSGGQRQRVALARALVHRPRLLLADEALSALDVTVRAQILDLLTELRTDLKLAIVFISHDLGVVQHHADRVLVMRNGSRIELGTTEQVLGSPAEPYTRHLIASVPRLPERTEP